MAGHTRDQHLSQIHARTGMERWTVKEAERWEYQPGREEIRQNPKKEWKNRHSFHTLSKYIEIL